MTIVVFPPQAGKRAPRDGAAKYSNHNVHSPLLNAQTACGACDTDVEYVVGRVNIIQDSVWATMSITDDAIVAAIDAIEAAGGTVDLQASSN